MPAPKGNQYALGNNGGARTKYQPVYAEQARRLCEQGFTETDLADFFGVVTSTIWSWQLHNEDFAKAIKVGREPADDRVEVSFFKRCTGFFVDTEKVFFTEGQVTRVPIREYYPPDAGAALNWLKNRRPDVWREKQVVQLNANLQHSHELPDLTKLTDEELQRRYVEAVGTTWARNQIT